MLKVRQNRKHYSKIRTLLLNCVKLLNQEKHPQVCVVLKLQFYCLKLALVVGKS